MSRLDVVVAESGQGYRQYRIPALAVTGAGTLVAAYDGRQDLDDLPGPIDLVVRRSLDGGRTWLPQQVIRAADGLTGHGDGSLLVDRQTGTVLCFHASGTAVGFFESSTGTADDDPTVLHTDLAVSDDDGATWSVRRLSHQLRTALNARLPEVTGDPTSRVSGLFAASGSGTQVREGRFAGRLLQGLVALVDGAVYAAVARSDDHGTTWQVGRPIGPAANENAVAALADGRVLLHSRAPGHRLASWSTDGGDTFGPLHPVPELPDPGNNGALVRLDEPRGAGRTVGPGDLVATHTRDPHLRRGLVAARSRDGAATFTAAAVLTTRGAGYSVAQPLDDDTIGVLWEDEGYRRLVFTRLPLAELVPADLAGPDHPAVAGVLDHVVARRPERWADHGGPTVSLGLAAPDEWDRAVYKIVDTSAAHQVVRTRENYLASLGAPTPGLHEGDTLTCSARLGTGPDGAAVLVREVRHIVTAADLAAGGATVELAADVDGRRRSTTVHVPVRPPALEG